MKSQLFALAGAALRLAAMASGVVLILTAVGGTAWGYSPPIPSSPCCPPRIPEIDPGSITSALALLGGGILMLTDKFSRKK